MRVILHTPADGRSQALEAERVEVYPEVVEIHIADAAHREWAHAVLVREGFDAYVRRPTPGQISVEEYGDGYLEFR